MFPPDSPAFSERLHNAACVMTRVRLLAGLGVALICGRAWPVGAISVDFGAINAGPSNFCEVGGVSVSGTPSWGPGGEPVAVAGSGLGSTTVGAVSSVDRFMTFSAGQLDPSVDLREGLQLTVDGRINSITFSPYFSVVGQSGSTELPFQMTVYPQAFAPGVTPNQPLRPTWVNLDGPYPPQVIYSDIFNSGDFSSFVIDLETSGQPPGFNFSNYLSTYGTDTDVSFQFGFTILALDYTPTTVPEPTAAALMALGAMLLGFLRRETKKAAKAA